MSEQGKRPKHARPAGQESATPRARTGQGGEGTSSVQRSQRQVREAAGQRRASASASAPRQRGAAAGTNTPAGSGVSAGQARTSRPSASREASAPRPSASREASAPRPSAARAARPAAASASQTSRPARDPELARYGAGNYSAHRRSKAPLIIGAILAVAVICAGVALAANFLRPAATETTSPANTESAATEGAAAEEATAAASVVIDGSDQIVMTLGGSQDTYVLAGESYLEASCRAFDKTEGNISSSVQVTGTVDASTPGDYEITYTATNSAGAQASKVRRVHVVDSFDTTTSKLPVLMYHYVYTADDVPSDLNVNYILDTDLAAQLQYLVENNYYYPSYQEIAAFVAGTHTLPGNSVVLTFDDCSPYFLKYGVPLLNQYQVPATSFVICNDSDAYEKVMANLSEYVTYQSHSYAMHQAGSSVGRGGIIHAMTKDEIVADLQKCAEILGPIEAFAYPFGDNNEIAQEALREVGVLCAFTIVNDRISPGDNPEALNRVRISGDYTLEGFKWCVS